VLESSTVVSVEPPHSFRLWDEAVKSGKKLLERYQAQGAEDLRALPAEKLVGEADSQHHITVDGYALTETPYEAYRAGRMNETAILHGYNKEESAPFILFAHAKLKNYEQKVRGAFKEYADEVLALFPASTDAEADRNWANLFSVLFFNYSHYCLSRLASAQGIPVYEYYFSRDNGRLGSWHSGEEVYLYGNIPADSKLYDERDRYLSTQMTGWLLNFMRTGDPNGQGLPVWEKTDGTHLMQLDAVAGMTEDRYLKLYEILDRMQNFGK
jgi:para-nitrobenzyl esterase